MCHNTTIPTLPIPHLTRFFDRMRGALMAAPTSVEPVVQMPHAAPTMLRPRAKATPIWPQPYGESAVSSSDQPVYTRRSWQSVSEGMPVGSVDASIDGHTSAWMMEWNIRPHPRPPITTNRNHARTKVTQRAHAGDLRRLHHLASAPASAAPPLAAAAAAATASPHVSKQPPPWDRCWLAGADRSTTPFTLFETTAGT